MARTASLNTATNQFLISVVDDSTQLDGGSATAGYAEFGKVIAGLDVVDQINQVAVQVNGSSGELGLPVAPLFIQRSYQLK